MKLEYGVIILVTLSIRSVLSARPFLDIGTTSGPEPDDGYGSDGGYGRDTAGRIIDGITVRAVFKTLGRAWSAENLLQSTRIVCERLERDINDYLSVNTYSDLNATVICAMTNPRKDFVEECHHSWDAILGHANLDEFKEGEIGLVQLGFPRPRCPETEEDGGNRSSSSVSEAVTVDSLNLYDLCTEASNKKINNILFALMDWLGPSVLNNMYRLDPHSLCGAVRYILSMEPIDFIRQLIGIIKYPMADFLEYCHSFNICMVTQDDYVGVRTIRVIKELLIEYSDLDESAFCEFMSERQDRDVYLEKGKTIVKNIMVGTFLEVSRCTSVLSIVAPLDTGGIISAIITGYNLTIPAAREEFCRTAVDAYLTSFAYEPTQYNIPSYQKVSEEIPGILIELIRIYGATINSEILIDGLAIYCTVFKDMTKTVLGETIDVNELCTVIEDRDLATIENICLSSLLPTYGTYRRPIWLRPILTENPAITSFYVARQVTGIDNINKEEICSKAHERAETLTFKGLFKSITDIFLEESLPSVPGICQHWEEFICYYGSECRYYITARNTTGLDEYVAKEKRLFGTIASIASILAGFESPGEFCTSVTESIDPLTGRPSRAFVEITRERLIGVLFETYRCSQVVEGTLTIINENLYLYTTLYELTGYEDAKALCEDLADSFAPILETSTASSATASTEKTVDKDKDVARYNILAKISVHLKKASASD